MKRRMIGMSIIICCILLSGCSAVTEHGKYHFSVFSWLADSVWEEREHDCSIMVKDAAGEVLYESNDREVIDYFAGIIDKLNEEDVDLTGSDEIMYEYVVRDNEKIVSFYLYEPGSILSCGVGEIQVYFDISEKTKKVFMHPEEWMVTE